MREALFYQKIDGDNVRCCLCSHYCTIAPSKRGICGVRENKGGVLYSLVYGKLVSWNNDPIEKKPLFHFLPGSSSFSIATRGCNFRCKHCQNASISQVPKDCSDPGYILDVGYTSSPEGVVEEALRLGSSSIAYTYTEPTVFLEFALDTARYARQRGFKNVFVSNGYTSEDAFKEAAPLLDANNIDLKGDDSFYREVCGARLQPVLDTIKRMREAGIWIEITTLVIPGLNDSNSFLHWAAEFICSVDPSIPWHLSAFRPTYKMTDRPSTPASTLQCAREIGIKTGLRYVYTGNLYGDSGENTYCPSCKRVVIERLGFTVTQNNIKEGCCKYCGSRIDGVGL